MQTLLRNCRLVPALSGGWDNGLADVLLNGETIADIFSAGSGIRADSELDCQGKTLMPGLFDLHMHINWAYHKGELRLDDFKIFIESCISAKLYLDNGITTVRDLGSARRVSGAVRSAIAAGIFTGPRILCGGLILSPVSRPAEPDPYNFLRFVSGCDSMIRAVREEIGSGVDFVKLYTPLLPEEMHAAMRTAALYGKPVAVHAHDIDSIRLCIEVGVRTIEHGSYIDEQAIAQLKDSQTYLVPTLSVLSHEVATPGYTPALKKQVLAPLLEANAKNITAAYRAGLRLGFGTDSPIEELDRLPGLEFRMRHEYCGMKPLDLLLQATVYSAEIAGLAGITGEVRAGMCADLILVGGRPDEDISVMYRRPELVWVRGALHRPAQH